MTDNFRVSKNALFYRIKEIIHDEFIINVLDSAMDNIRPGAEVFNSEFRKNKQGKDIEDKFEYSYSFRIFPTYRPVYFYDDKSINDVIYAFILLIEYDDYISVFSKSCSSISDILGDKLELIDSRRLISTFKDDEVEFQKISLREMTVSDRALRSKSFEAANLQGVMSTHGAGKSIPHYLKVRQGNSTKSFSSTGRLVETSTRESIDAIALWVKKQIENIKKPGVKNFIDTFARKVELSEVLTKSTPNAILIEKNALLEKIKKESFTLRYELKSKKTIKLNSRVKNSLELSLEKVYEIDEASNIKGLKRKSKIKKNKKTITFDSFDLKRIVFMNGDKKVSLQKLIIENGLYSITFSDPSLMYFMGACFEDVSGISEIDNLLEILHPVDFSNVKNEKGSFNEKSDCFSSDSMFSVVEHIHSEDDYIFCDDLGNEWADHITFNKLESCICFVHSKHGKESTSASNLHDVIGQGIKNLGNMFSNKKDIYNKMKEKTVCPYNTGTGIKTNISRMRKGNIDELDEFLENILKDFKLNRRCILSCSFLSKNSLKKEFNKIKDKKKVKGNIIQLLWIISSFAHAAKLLNIIPIIYCNK